MNARRSTANNLSAVYQTYSLPIGAVTMHSLALRIWGKWKKNSLLRCSVFHYLQRTSSITSWLLPAEIRFCLIWVPSIIDIGWKIFWLVVKAVFVFWMDIPRITVIPGCPTEDPFEKYMHNAVVIAGEIFIQALFFSLLDFLPPFTIQSKASATWLNDFLIPRLPSSKWETQSITLPLCTGVIKFNGAAGVVSLVFKINGSHLSLNCLNGNTSFVCLSMALLKKSFKRTASSVTFAQNQGPYFSSVSYQQVPGLVMIGTRSFIRCGTSSGIIFISGLQRFERL